MGDYEQSRDVNAPAQALFDYLADVHNMPRYFSAMTSAEPAEGGAVHVTADVDGKEQEGEAWFKVDSDRMHLEWGSEGPNNYRGRLDVTSDVGASRVSVALHTENVEDPDLRVGDRT